MDTTELDQKLRDIIADVLEIEPEEISETSSFADDHGADSLRAIEILARIEKNLSVEIPQEELSKMVNLESVRAVILEHSGH